VPKGQRETPAAAAPVPAIERYPWHDANWAALLREIERLPHAILLHGPPGVGKYMFARRLVSALLCSQSGAQADACGNCRHCQMLQAGTHPDFADIEPAEPGKSITIDQIRALREFFVLRPHSADYKVALIAPADSMNLNAANGLLKMLEEPPLGSVLLLTSDQPARLPATIRSRCAAVRFPLPDFDLALAWLMHQHGDSTRHAELLASAGGAPLIALELERSGFHDYIDQLLGDLWALREGRIDPVACAESWRKMQPENCLSWFYRFVANLIKLAMNPPAIDYSVADKRQADLIAFANGLNLKQLFELLDLISRSKTQIGGPLDDKLLLEEIFIQWCRLTS
jgi:DNA polymerase-3 subunit delta'